MATVGQVRARNPRTPRRPPEDPRHITPQHVGDRSEPGQPEPSRPIRCPAADRQSRGVSRTTGISRSVLPAYSS